MTRFSLWLACLLSVFFISTNTKAAEPAVAKTEIAHLFSVLETSNCQFNRNGTWYSAKDAGAHLRNKYKYLQDNDLIPSAEKFIERAATQSSFSGKAYQIKCADNVVQTSNPWFQAALTKHRSAAKLK
jgi:Family of unknown function (DUF5329)